MSCNVSNSFKLDATRHRSSLIQLFQFCRYKNVKQPQNGAPVLPCFKVSVVSIYIHRSFATTIQKVLGLSKKLRVFLFITIQNSTIRLLSLQLAARISILEAQSNVPAQSCLLLGASIKLILQFTGFQKG